MDKLINSLNIYKNSVQKHEIDNLGHMNVQFYVQHCLDACRLFFETNNLINNNESIGDILFLEKLNIRFLNEQMLGTPFSIYFYVTSIKDNIIEIFQEMKNLESANISTTFLLKFKFNIHKKKSMEVLQNFSSSFSDKLIPVPLYGQKKGLLNLNHMKLNYKEIHNKQNIFSSFCGIAKKRTMNNWPFLDAADYMGIVSTAVPHLLQISNHSISRTDIGGAAVEYEFYFYGFVGIDSSIKLLSGLRKINNKTYTWSHWLVDLNKQKILTLANSVIVTMDLKTRKSVILPYQMKENLRKILVK